MKSSRTEAFRLAFDKLPKSIQKQARRAYGLFAISAAHPSLRFKRVHAKKPIFSVRVSRDYRALGIKTGDEIVWF